MSTTSFRSFFAKTGARLLRSRRLMRTPIWIYKARAGALFGSGILMLEHIGRKSGAMRYAALEIVDHPAPDVYVVPSGFGRKAQWFRNIQINPRVRVYTGSRKPAAATARILDQGEVDRILASYRHRHSQAWKQLKPIIEETLGASITETGTPLPMVELRLDA